MPLTGKQHRHAENISISMYIYISKYIHIYRSIQSCDNTCAPYLIIPEFRHSSSTYINIIIIMVEKMISRLSRMKLKTLKWCFPGCDEEPKKGVEGIVTSKQYHFKTLNFVFVARHHISVNTKLNLALGKYKVVLLILILVSDTTVKLQATAAPKSLLPMVWQKAGRGFPPLTLQGMNSSMTIVSHSFVLGGEMPTYHKKAGMKNVGKRTQCIGKSPGSVP